MLKLMLAAVALGTAFAIPTLGEAQCVTLPYNLSNGSPADATQVMGDFHGILSCPVFSGTAVVMANTSSQPAPAGTLLEVVGANGATTRSVIDSYLNGNSAAAPNFVFRSSEGTGSSPSGLLTNDLIGALSWFGYGTTGYSLGSRVQIRGLATQNWSDSAQGTAISFWTNPNNGVTPIEAVRIDNTGFVGIGTTTPLAPLEVDNSATVQPRGVLSVQYSSDAASALFSTRKARGTQSSPSAVINGDYLGAMSAAGYDGSAYSASGSVGFQVNGTVASGSVPTDFVVLTGTANPATEKMRVTSSGNVGIGTTNPTATLYVMGTAISTGGWGVPSDGRLKRNVEAIKDPLGIVEKLEGVRYRFLPAAERTVGGSLMLPTQAPQIGFIAQDVQKVVPEAVAVPPAGGDSVYTMDATKLVPILVEAVKAQQAEIAEQQREIRQLQDAISEGSAKPSPSTR